MHIPDDFFSTLSSLILSEQAEARQRDRHDREQNRKIDNLQAELDGEKSSHAADMDGLKKAMLDQYSDKVGLCEFLSIHKEYGLLWIKTFWSQEGWFTNEF